MINENAYKGGIGEVLGARLLLNYFNVARTIVDDGIDFICCPKEHSTPVFHVQVKTGKFEVKTSVLKKWVRLVTSSPVILLKVTTTNLLVTKYEFLVLWEWFPSERELYKKIANQRSFTFPITAFREVTPSGEEFSTAINEELARVTDANNQFHIAKAMHIPLEPEEIFDYAGKLGGIEPPAQLIRLARKYADGRGQMAVRQFLLNLRRSAESAALEPDRWHLGLGTSPAPSEREFEFQEFQRFLRALAFPDGDFWQYIPDYHHHRIGCWRVFVQMFPSSIDLLRESVTAERKLSSDQLATVFLLLSTLANCGEPARSDAAIDVLRSYPGRNDFRHRDLEGRLQNYIVSRQFVFSLAEATGESSDVQTAHGFITMNSADRYLLERKLHQRYYREKGGARFLKSIARKLESPTLREEKTRVIQLLHYEEVLPHEQAWTQNDESMGD